MTNKELKEKISRLFGYFDNTEFGDVISFTRAGKEKELMDLIKEVVESITPEAEKIDQALIDSGEWEQKYAIGHNEAIETMKDNLDKLLKE